MRYSKTKILKLFFAIFLFALAFYVIVRLKNNFAFGIEVNQRIPDLSFMQISGAKLNFGMYKGGKFIFSYISLDCLHCVQLLLKFTTLNDYLKRYKISLIVITDADESQIREFRIKYDLKFDIYQDVDRIKRELNIQVLPTLYFVDDRNVVKHRQMGYQNIERAICQFVQL